MTYIEIINEICDIQRLSSEDQKTKADALIKIIESHKKNNKEKETTEKIILLLNNIKLEPKTLSVESASPNFEAINTFGYPKNYEKFFKAQDYLEILQFTKLACKFESTGNPEEQALKLLLLFGSKKGALDYLTRFSKKNPGAESIVQAACSFKLPISNSNKDFSHWKRLAGKDENQNMFKAEFKHMLSISQELEAIIIENKSKSTEILNALMSEIKNKKNDFESIEVKEKESDKNFSLKVGLETIKKKLAESNKICKQYENNIPAGVRERIGFKNYQQALKESVRLSEKCSRFTAINPFQQFNLEMLTNTVNSHILKNPQGSAAYFIEHGIPLEKYYDFLALNRSHAGENIPNITIDGDSLNLPGYYLKKLDVQNEAEAARAACLGKLSNCCQSFSGELGESCVKHGLTSPNGGFYAVFKGSAKDPKIEDELVCQSWVWRSKSGALVIDSIEAKNKTDAVIETSKKFYHALTSALVKNHQINQVNGGVMHTSTGISKALCPSEQRQILEVPIDYKEGYRDSHMQFMVAASDALYLLPGKENEFFEKCQSEGLSSTAPAYIKMIEFSLKTKNDTLLKRFYEIFPQNSGEIVRSCATYMEALNNDISKILAVPIKPYLLNLSNERGETLLYLAAKAHKWDVVKALGAQNANLNTAQSQITTLHLAAQDGQLDFIKDLLKQAKQKIDLNAKNMWGQTPLHVAAEGRQWDVVKWLAAQGADLNAENNDGNTVLHIAVNFNYPDVVNTFVEQGFNLNATNNRNETALHLAAWEDNWSFIKSLAEQGANVNAKDLESRTVLHFAAKAKKWDLIKDLVTQEKIHLDPPTASWVETAVFIAIEHDQADLLRWLLVQGVSLDIKNTNGHTPQEIAQKKNSKNVIALLHQIKTDEPQMLSQFANFVKPPSTQTPPEPPQNGKLSL